MKKRSERKKLCIRICLTVIAVVTALIFIMPIVLTISGDHLQLLFYFPENGYRGQAVHLSDGKPQIYTGYGDFLTVCDRVI